MYCSSELYEQLRTSSRERAPRLRPSAALRREDGTFSSLSQTSRRLDVPILRLGKHTGPRIPEEWLPRTCNALRSAPVLAQPTVPRTISTQLTSHPRPSSSCSSPPPPPSHSSSSSCLPPRALPQLAPPPPPPSVLPPGAQETPERLLRHLHRRGRKERRKRGRKR